MHKKLLILAATAIFLILAPMAFAGAAPQDPPPCTGSDCTGNPDCPDDDGDGICNGQDPDYPGCTGCTGNPDCPDDDGDGICNGQDPDYIPGSHCGGHNPTCPDADGDGICNGQDPDYVPGSGGPGRGGRIHRIMRQLRTMFGVSL